MKTQQFCFQHDKRNIYGFIDQPETNSPKALIVIIPGDGKTKFVNDKYYIELREELTKNNFGCCVWDKIGCGKNKGKYKQIPVANSSNEAISAISELRRRKIKGSNKIGLWGISRAGWICPLIIEKDPSICFWISISGTNEEENFAYLLRCNLEKTNIDSREKETIVSEWIYGTKAFLQGESVFTYLRLTNHLRYNEYYRKHYGPTSNLAIVLGYKKLQKIYLKNEHYFDEKSGLEIYVKDMKEKLRINCPVLAIFGKNDINVDWKKTK
jgi:uncharacterized protein